MKIGIIQTAPNNCAALDKIAARYHNLEIVHYVDGCLWAHFEAAGNVVNDKVNEILAADFNKLIDAGCGSIGLLCNQIKSGIEKVQESVALPIWVYDDVLARRAVDITPEGGKIAVAAMNTAALGPTKEAVEFAAKQAGKNIEVEAVYAWKLLKTAWRKPAATSWQTNISSAGYGRTSKNIAPSCCPRCR